MFKTIGIIVLLIGIVFLLSWGSPGGSGGSIDGTLILGLGLAVLGIWLMQYDPIGDVKRDVAKGASSVIKGIQNDGDASVEKAKEKVKKVVDDTEATARKRIHSIAKELDELAEK